MAAGKRLVEYHKKAKKALEESKDKPKDDSSSWMPDINFATAIGIVGIGLTSVDLYFRLRKNKNEEKKYKPNLEPIKETVEPEPGQS